MYSVSRDKFNKLYSDMNDNINVIYALFHQHYHKKSDISGLPPHQKHTDKTEVLLLTTQKNIEKGPGNKYGKNQLSQINFPTWERMQKLEDSATAPCH